MCQYLSSIVVYSCLVTGKRSPYLLDIDSDKTKVLYMQWVSAEYRVAPFSFSLTPPHLSAFALTAFVSLLLLPAVSSSSLPITFVVSPHLLCASGMP